MKSSNRSHALACVTLMAALTAACGKDDPAPNTPATGGNKATGGSPGSGGTSGAGGTPATGGSTDAGTDAGTDVTSGDAGDSGGGDAGFPTALVAEALTTYKALVYKTYDLSLTEAQKLKTAITAFTAAPDAAKLKAARDAWSASRLPYNQTDAYRFYDGPIDNEDTGPEGAINGWPLDENYVDYTRDAATAGIINDATKYADISKAKLAELNEVGGEKNLATGYHAIEFLLWGQDEATAGSGAGKRPHTDFVTGAGATAANQARRRAYLEAVTDLLIDDLTAVRTEWAPGAANYGADFGSKVDADAEEKDPKKDALGKVIRGLGSLARAELSGERMTVAYKNRDQEDEHSCFSDTTWLDLLGNAKGIKNVWTGSYEGQDLGKGLEDVYAAVDSALATKIGVDINEAVTKLGTLAGANATAPFDVVIGEADNSANRTLMLDAIKALKRVADGLSQGATTLGVKVAFEDPSPEGSL